MRKTVIFFIVLGLAIAAGAWYYKQSALQKQAETNPQGSGGGERRTPVVTVGVTTVKTGSVDEKLMLTGALKPKEQVDVNPQSTGRLQKIHVNVGDAVKAGSLIAELEQDELLQQVRRSEAAMSVVRATLAQRAAELANASAQLGRAEELWENELISRQDFDALKTQTEVVRAQVRLSEAQMQQAEAELRELRIRLEQTRILAPMTGVIATRYVDAGALLGPTTPIVRIVNLSTMVTAASVPERDVGKLRVGHSARVRVDAFGPQEFMGRVARISPVLDAATRTAGIEIEIRNPSRLLKAEMFARVELNLASTRQAVLIPREALVYRGSQPGVFLVRNDRPEFRPIETGLTQGDYVEVVSALAPGTQIVGRGSAMISEGNRIRVASSAEPNDGPPRVAENVPKQEDRRFQ
ncbi:MAG: efflux RND transporter periplasmic adaptor subunit [Bryobacteraceae bacterium]|nr:efflux RND transporter periplasmic adaptor subunit [Bryobacteraceae bacterium]